MSLLLAVASVSRHAVHTCTVPMGNCTYGHQPHTILYLQDKVITLLPGQPPSQSAQFDKAESVLRN